MERTFLVTGGAGYIGTNVIYYLLKHNYKIVVADNFSNAKSDGLNRLKKYFNYEFKIYDIDLCNKSKLNQIFIENKISDVLHLAAKKYIPESFIFKDEYLKNNCESTKNLLECMSQNNVHNIYFASSITVYGEPKVLPLKEDSPICPLSPYAQSKVFCEEYVAGWQKENSKNNAIIFRFTNPVGARTHNVFLGDAPNGSYSTLLPYLVKCVNENIQIKINGNDHNTPDGTTVRDYINITDLAWCVCKLITKGTKGLQYIIVGNGEITYSVLDMIKALEKVYNKKIDFVVNPKRENDVPIIEVDNSYIVNNLHYAPKCNSFDMVKSQVEFATKNF